MILAKAKDLNIFYDKNHVLKNVSFDVGPGEIVGVIGPNGAGKTTILKAFAKLIQPTTGSLEILGKYLSEIRNEDSSKIIAYLPQNHAIYWSLSVERVIALGRIPHLMPWQKSDSQDKDIIYKSMKMTDTDALRNRDINALSGGEQTLVMIARVLAQQTPLILADEPMQGLDPNHQIKIMELFKKIAGENKGIIIVMHDLSLAARFCDKLILLNEGHVLDSGPPRKVLSPENLKDAFRIEARFQYDKKDLFLIPWKCVCQ